MSFLQIMSPLLSAPPINILLQTLLRQYLSDSYCLTFVLENPIHFNVNGIYTYITPSNGTVDDLTDQLLEMSEADCSDYIVYMSDPQKFMAAFDQVSRKGSTRRSNRKIIILPYSSDESYINQSLDLLSMKESSFVANLLLILSNKEADTNCEIYDLITHEFVSLDHDQSLYLDQWDSCKEKFVINGNLFPHDMKNLNGRIVRVACFTYKPYSLLDLDPALVESRRDGIEVRIVDEFCKWVNCTIEVVPEDKGQWGEVFENGTGIGVIGGLAEDRADMGISALYSWYEEFLRFDFSAAVIRSGVTCVAPSPRLLASWEMPLMPFSWYMWYAVIISFMFASVGLIIAKGSTDEVFLTIFGIMLAQTQSDESASWRIRSITGWLLGASLVLVSAYGAGLASTFTVPKYEPSIDTVSDLVDRNMEWGATHDAWIFSLTLSKEPLVKQLLSQFRIYSAEELESKSFTRSMAFSIEKLPAGHFAIGDYITKKALLDYTVMLEDFYYEQCVVMMRKSSMYTEKMSSLIGTLHQSGLMLAWETQVSLKYLNFEVQQEVKLSRVTDSSGFTTPLSLRHVVGLYILYVTGVALATFIFVGEYCTGKKIDRTRESFTVEIQ